MNFDISARIGSIVSHRNNGTRSIVRSCSIPAWFCKKRRASAREVVQVSGFGCHAPEPVGHRHAIWTKGKASFECQFSRTQSIGWVWIEIASTGSQKNTVDVLVNGNRIARKEVRGHQWIRARLPNGFVASRVSLTLESKCFVPSEVLDASTDDRVLGVAVERLVFAKQWWRFAIPRPFFKKLPNYFGLGTQTRKAA